MTSCIRDSSAHAVNLLQQGGAKLKVGQRLCRHPLAWAGYSLALWQALTTPDAPSTLATRLRVAEVALRQAAAEAAKVLRLARSCYLSVRAACQTGTGCKLCFNFRKGLLQVLTHGTSGSEGLGGAWVALSALRLQCLDGQTALDAAAAGLAWLRARQEVLPGSAHL
jgi:hypothetical protein